VSVGRVIDRLEKSFGKELIFRDLDSIEYGQDFSEVIKKALAECKVLLVVIGNDWVSIQDEAGKRRLDDPEDWVRLEVSTALEQSIHVIPILVENAAMPSANLLPENLKPLAKRNAAPVRDDPDFNGDMERLCRAIRKHLSPTRFKFDGLFPKPILLVVAAIVSCILVVVTVSRLGLIGPSIDKGTGSHEKEVHVRPGMVDVDVMLSHMRSKEQVLVIDSESNKITFRKATDQDLIEPDFSV
jgi:hypothetical protein